MEVQREGKWLERPRGRRKVQGKAGRLEGQNYGRKLRWKGKDGRIKARKEGCKDHGLVGRMDQGRRVGGDQGKEGNLDGSNEGRKVTWTKGAKEGWKDQGKASVQ